MNKKDSIIFAVLWMIVGAIIALSVPHAFSGHGGSHARHSGVDSYYMLHMVAHHSEAVAMAELAEQKAEHQEIRDLAKRIIESQSAEMTMLTEWYADWFQSVPQDHVGHESLSGNGDEALDSLKNASSFDKAFIEQMIAHHQMAVAMSEMIVRHTERKDLKAFGNSVIEEQSREIEQMREWYRAWYQQS